MSTTLGGGEESVVEEEVEVESKLGEEEAREERERRGRTVDGTSLIAKQNCDWSSLGQNYLVTELEIALLHSVTLVFFNDQMSQTIVEHQEKAAFAEQVARRVGRKFHGGEEKQVWGAQVNIVGRVGQRQDYIHLIQDNPIEQLFGHIELLHKVNLPSKYDINQIL